MKKQIIVTTAALLLSVSLTACTGTKQSPATDSTSAVKTQSAETTSAQTIETTSAPVIIDREKANKFVGSYNELTANQRCSMTLSLNADTYDTELNIANNTNIKDTPLGIYKSSFKYGDIEDKGDGLYTVTTTAVNSANNSVDITITFYGEEGSITGASLSVKNAGIELIKGSPAN